MAIILNGSDVVEESVDLLQINSHDQTLWVNFFSWTEFSLDLFRGLLNCFAWVGFDLMKHFIWLTQEKLTSEGIVPIFVLVIESWESFKHHIICRAAPEELFLWEFKSVVVANAHGDVVIGFDAADSAPKE